MKKLISIVVPVYNEELNVKRAYEAISDAFSKLNKYELELLFADNKSTDNTFEILQELAKTDSRIKVIRYNRNYGFQRSLFTAYCLCTGAAAIQIDCDLQDSPDMFETFLKHWEEGHDLVVGIRKNREENKLITAGRRYFYALLDKISEDNITRNAGDFRLVDRGILDMLQEINDPKPYVRGLTSSLASNVAEIPYDRTQRLYGKSKFPLRKMIGFALEGIFAHSSVPLRLATYIGIFAAVITTILSGFFIVGALLFGSDWPQGFATLSVLILFGISLNGIFMGVIGEYIYRIYCQGRKRPLTIIQDRINLEADRT